MTVLYLLYEFSIDNQLILIAKHHDKQWQAGGQAAARNYQASGNQAPGDEMYPVNAIEEQLGIWL